MSVLKQIWHQRRCGVVGFKLRRIDLVWVCKEVGAFAWVQELLRALEDEKLGLVLRLHLYLTQKMEVDDVQHYAIHGDATTDPFTKLKTRTTFGRPRWSDLLAQIKHECAGTRIGVYLCGPPGLSREVERTCRTLSTKSCTLHYHKEHF